MERYRRNIELLGNDAQEKILKAKVLIAGAGGLGSTVIANLASLGVGNIGIIDCDTVEISNLNRQYIHSARKVGQKKTESAKEWINLYNHFINVKCFDIKLDCTNYEAVVNDYDIIADCFDSYKSKFLLNEIALKTNKPLVHAGVSGFSGQVFTIIPHKTACLRCLLPDADEDENITEGVISPVVSTIASIQVGELLKIIINTGELLTNQLLTFDALKTEFKKIKFEKNINCPVCKEGEIYENL